MNRRFTSHLYNAFCIGLIGVSGQVAHGIVIDDFTSGSIVVTGPAVMQQTELDPAHVLGGVRNFNVGQNGNGSVVEIDPTNRFSLHSTGYGYFDIGYDLTSSSEGVNLIQGGADRFSLHLGTSTATYTPMALGVDLPPNSSYAGFSFIVDNGNGAWNNLILDFPFSLFHSDLTSTHNIHLSAIRNAPGTSLNILTITTAGTPVTGDYNRDGIVDGKDFFVWQHEFGVTTRNGLVYPVAAADGNGDGIVNSADYTVWRDHLGTQQASNSEAATQVPEPTSVALSVCAAVFLFCRKAF
jgi:hypothetical protein